MGVLASKAGLAVDAFAIAQKMTRWVLGGLGVATTVACGGFSAVTSSTSVAGATIGRISVEQMTRRGYRANAAAALVALGATVGVLIPPSIVMVIFVGILTGQSIGKLLLAGLIPGLVTMFFYIGAVIVFCKRGTSHRVPRKSGRSRPITSPRSTKPPPPRSPSCVPHG